MMAPCVNDGMPFAVIPLLSYKLKLTSCVGFVEEVDLIKQTTWELQQDVYGDVR